MPATAPPTDDRAERVDGSTPLVRTGIDRGYVACYTPFMTNNVRHALRDYLQTIEEHEIEFNDEVITQVNIRSNERMTAAIDALAQRMKMSRSATARFILEAAIYDALAEIGMQIGVAGVDRDKPVWAVMTNEEQLEVIARAQQEHSG